MITSRRVASVLNADQMLTRGGERGGGREVQRKGEKTGAEGREKEDTDVKTEEKEVDEQIHERNEVGL